MLTQGIGILLLISGSVDSFRHFRHARLLSNSASSPSSLNVASADAGKVNAKARKPVIAPIFDESCDYTGVTLTRYMVETSTANPHLRELENVMISIQTACKAIASVVERASITGVTGYEDGGGSINVQGEEQKRLDVITNDIMSRNLKFSGRVAVVASEEEDTPFTIDNQQAKMDKYKDQGLTPATQFNSAVLIEDSGDFVTVFDPLDGSSNVDAGIPTGTIFGIFAENPDSVCELPEDGEDLDENAQACIAGTLQPGSNLVAAGYCLYSSSVFFCLTLGNGVNIFTYDRSVGEFVLTHPNVKIPPRGNIYSFNEGNRWCWEQPLTEYVTAIQKGEGETGNRYSLRYIGSMVGDVHRTLLYGGIFGYPATTKDPSGKLRLLYEAAPMSFLMEQAGGMATTGRDRIMDLQPENVHARVPCMMGSVEDVKEMLSYYEKASFDSADL